MAIFWRILSQEPDEEEGYSFGSHAAEYMEFTVSEHQTAQGRAVTIVESTPMESGAVGITGYMVENSVVQSIHVVSVEGNQEKIWEVLDKLLEYY